jgi:1-acyl-sn-glycerol-3-phosphate acyltransferase
MNSKMTGYKIFKSILSPIYRFWYNPKVKGKENIPKEGAIILAGNHIHIMDQCNIIISTKRHIHYMAKKEYFDKQYKEGKFAWFFRTVGCIPVDRSTKDENAKSSAIEVLNNKHALGIFPEGTRNGLKEARIKELYDKYFNNTISYKKFYKKIKKNKKTFIDYLEKLKDDKVITKEEFINNIYNSNEYLLELIKNKKITKKDYYDNYLLPLKFGAVSMASKTNSLIVPYAITGTYKFRSKDLTVNIGKPIKVDSDLEKVNKKLEEEIKKLVKENLENND